MNRYEFNIFYIRIWKLFNQFFFKNISKFFLNVITIHCYDVFDVPISWSQERWLKYCALSQTVMCWLTKIICIFLFVDQDKAPPRRSSNAWLTQLLHHVGEHAREIPVPLLLWTLFSSAATVCLLNSLRSRAHHHQHESLQNKHADKQAAGRTCSKVAQEDEKKHEEEDGKEQEEDATSEEEQEGEIEEEVNTEKMKVDSLKKRKWGFFDRLRTF